MAGRRAKTRKTILKRRNRQRASGPRVTTGTNSSKSTGVGTVLHKGVRSVLSVLPGSAITTKIADVIFRGFGWSDARASGGKFDGDTNIYALTTSFFIMPVMFLGNASTATSPVKNNLNPEIRQVYVNYTAGRVVHFKISARNSGAMSVHGMWGIGFWPFDGAKDENSLAALAGSVPLSTIRQAHCFVEGPVTKPLVLKHYFTLSNFYARTPGDLARRHGIIVITYEELNRASYTQFTSADFDPQIDVSANVLLTTRTPDLWAVTNRVDAPQSIAASIRTPDGEIHLKNDSAYSCTEEAGKSFCHVKGTVSTPSFASTSVRVEAVQPITLDGLALQ